MATLLLLAYTLSPVIAPATALSMAEFNRDPNSDQFAPGYDPTGANLELNRNVYSQAVFNIVIKDGVGHLQSTSLTEKADALKEPGLLKWSERTGFFDGPQWIRLSLETATELFGKPRKREKDGVVFYNFDVFSACLEYRGERQLYHIDMKFDTKGFLEAYRVRGIGICNPLWTTD